MAKPYNGHHCRNCWNVALWIANDEPLYRWALECKRATKRQDDAVRMFLSARDGFTPDGARYTKLGVKLALAGLE